jgi:hypothetical protein
MPNRFDLEEKILVCWGIMEDIELIYRMTDRENPDHVCNTLLGLHTIYDMKFEDLFECFSQIVHEGTFNASISNDSLSDKG